MEPDEITQFAQLMTGVAETYGRTFSQGMTTLYWNATKRYTLADVTRAVNQHIMHPDYGKYFPKPADIVRMIDGDPESQAMVAWNKVHKAIEGVGPYRTVVFDDPLIHHAIEQLGGWPEVNKWTEGDLPYRSNDFRKIYKAAHGREIEYPNRLRGLEEINNAAEGMPIGLPRFVGDRQRAEQVLVEGKQESTRVKISGPASVTELAGKLKKLEGPKSEET